MKDTPRATPILIVLGVGVAIWWIPSPEGVTAEAWHLLAIFVATIVGIVLKPVPMGAVAIIGITVTAITGTLTIGESLGLQHNTGGVNFPKTPGDIGVVFEGDSQLLTANLHFKLDEARIL